MMRSQSFFQKFFTQARCVDLQGTVVVQLVAKDQDALNEPVVYAISGEGSQYFSVSPNTGMVTVVDTSGMIKGTQYLLQAKVTVVSGQTSIYMYVQLTWHSQRLTAAWQCQHSNAKPYEAS